MPEWDPGLNALMIRMLARERESEIAKMEYLVWSQAVLNGISKDQYKQKVDLLNELKMNMSEVVHQDVYVAGYQRQKKQKAIAEKRRELEMMKKLQEMGSKKE